MKSPKIFVALASCISLLLLSGCGITTKNLTPTEFPTNPSNIYTLSLEVRENDSNIANDSIVPLVVIDGESRLMKPSPVGENIWDYEYVMPQGRRNAVYYFEIEYDTTSPQGRKTKTITLPRDGLLKFSLANHYVITLEANRGPVGSQIGLVGRGFSNSDQVFVGNTPAPTEYYSPNALSFYIPSLPAARNYEVTLRSQHREIPVGSFRIDPAMMRVVPGSLQMSSGSSSVIMFSIPNPAPMGGLAVSTKTNVPDSIIMPEVVIPEGEQSVSVRIEGGAPGIGVLYIEAAGYAAVEVPVQVL